MTLELSRFQSALLIREGSQKWLHLTQQRCVYIYGARPYSVSLLPLSRSFTAIPLRRNPHCTVYNHPSPSISPQVLYHSSNSSSTSVDSVSVPEAYSVSESVGSYSSEEESSD